MFDEWRLYNYQAPAAIVKLADNTTMVQSMRRLFYVYHPEIENKTDFNAHCRDDEQTIVLGCYVDGKGIYIFDVTDDRLAGIEEVTAAHEALHAVYERLSSSERKKVDAMTAAAFAQLSDQGIKDRIELYRKQDPKVVPNELHSILGTEDANLPTDLETYYQQYFSNRAKIVAYAAAYSGAFTDRKNQIAAYDAELSSLKTQINKLQSQLTSEQNGLETRRSQLDSLRSSGQTSAYNAAVPGYNAQVVTYNNHINQLSDLIDEYNSIVPKRNELATEEESLVKAIDSRDVPSKQ